MSTFYAQPYDINAKGFFFDSAESYRDGTAGRTNCYGMPVEEYEIQFIDGELIDAALANALEVNQATISAFFEAEADWSEDQKLRVIISEREIGNPFDLEHDDPDDLNIDLYEMDSLRELAEQFVEEGLFGDIPEYLANYIDLDAIARDLSMDYAETNIAGRRFIYRSA
ncbi:MAG: antirestriction protein ArdA [Rhizobiales bacterium NRL2]|jgi:antirestriction protein|nr:MAG: antirestriction protein ArdA [Rhizobiales bacterium NRL2]